MVQLMLIKSYTQNYPEQKNIFLNCNAAKKIVLILSVSFVADEM